MRSGAWNAWAISLAACCLLTVPEVRGREPSPLPQGQGEDPVDWWAYVPLGDVAIERSAGQGGGAHPVDRLLGQHLAGTSLEPAPRATPLVLLRRATFALTGLPPTREARARFLEDVASRGFDGAWAALLDELFASPHYGESEARRWLDVVRYGETNGYERDSAKPNIWRYRDWVIRALQADLPYDQFIGLQIAGDEYAAEMTDLAERTDALLATGFYRLGLWDDEPADRPQAKADEHAEIVDTISQTVFGSTMGCARCHDHKADPFTQAEYFALTAHFAGVRGYSYDGALDLAEMPKEGVITEEERDELVEEIDREIREHLDAQQPTGRETAESSAGAGDVGAGAKSAILGDARAAEANVMWRYAESAGKRGDSAAAGANAERMSGWEQPGFDDEAWKEGPGAFGTKGTPHAIIGTPWASREIRMRTTFALEEIPESVYLTLHHDDDVIVYLNGQVILTRAGYRTDYTAIQLRDVARGALVVGRNVLAVFCMQDFGGQVIDVGLHAGFEPAGEAADLCRLESLGDAPCLELLDRRERARTHPVSAPFPAQVVSEVGRMAPDQFIHGRGSVHAPGDKVEPTLPAAWVAGSRPGAATYHLPEPSPDARTSGRRRALSDWAFDGGAHLTARVEANRLWQGLFGRGLCRTAGDFGRLGERPTHPELLDRVAEELIRSEWSRKSVQKWLMLSRTYQRSSRASEVSIAGDPRNDHLARFDPRRLTGEELRDAALFVTGELNRRVFGPWVFPPMAKEVLATASRPDQAWGRSTPEDANRRSLYVHVKRSLREPLLAAFDQPDPDLPCAVRFPTNVPTQALLTLNGEFMGARATAFAEVLASEAEGEHEQIGLAIEIALQREPEPGEVERAAELLEALRREHGAGQDEVLRLFALGLLNRNEFIWVD